MFDPQFQVTEPNPFFIRLLSDNLKQHLLDAFFKKILLKSLQRCSIGSSCVEDYKILLEFSYPNFSVSFAAGYEFLSAFATNIIKLKELNS